MIPKCLLFTILHISSCMCQYMVDTSLRADMGFDDENDRFDVSNIIAEQNRMNDEQPTAMDYDSRRSGHFDEEIPLVEVIKLNRRLMNKNREAKLRRRLADYAHHDQMEGPADLDDDTYAKNLLKFRAEHARRNEGLQVIDLEQLGRSQPTDRRNRRSNGGKEIDVTADSKILQDMVFKYLHQGKAVRRRNGRRGFDKDNGIMLGYAVPFNLKVNGYLEAPQEE